MTHRDALRQRPTLPVLLLSLALILSLGSCTSPQAETYAAGESASQEATENPKAPEEGASEAQGTGEGESPSSEVSEVTDKPAKKDKKKSSKKKPTYDTAQKKRLEEQITGIVESSSMQVGVAAIDLTNSMPVDCHGSDQMQSASMIKLLIASTLLQKVEAGDLSLNDTYALKPEDIVGGAGSMGGRGAGAEVTYDELLETMIAISDNTSANALISTLGMDAINDEAKRLKLKATSLNRRMMDAEALAAGIDNFTCANDLAKILSLTYQKKLAKPELCERLMQALEHQEDVDGIKGGLPEGTVFAHKTGSLDHALHDGGIVEGDHPYILVVLCSGDVYSGSAAYSLMADIARTVYAELVK